MKRYEYLKVNARELTYNHYVNINKEALDSLGKQGWELVLINSGEFIFKREVSDDRTAVDNKWVELKARLSELMKTNGMHDRCKEAYSYALYLMDVLEQISQQKKNFI